MLQIVRPVRDLSSLPATRPLPSPRPGPLVEFSGGPGSARVTLATSRVRHAQREGETTVWIQKESGSLFPPDLAEAGVDLDALIVVRIPESAAADGPFRAAEMLLRSGAFGVIVLDVRDGPSRIPAAVQGRLLGAAREHRAQVIFLTGKTAETESLGSLVALRLEPRRVRVGPGTFVIETRILKNKHGLPLDEPIEHRRGPWGLR